MTRSLRVCMLVYNNCTTDARVRKEAASLVAAGHEVTVVGVLDARTVAEERRDGIAIVRIDRNPPHYRLLRASRRARRRVRRLVRTARRARGAPRRAIRSWRRSLRKRPRPITRIRPATPAPPSSSGPARLYRAVRWRVLRASPFLARRYYRRRSRRRSRTALAEFRRGAALARTEPEARLEVIAHEPSPPAPTPSVSAPPTGLLARIERRVSGLGYRALMTAHKPLLYASWYRHVYRRLRAQDFDVVHAHDLNTLPVAAVLARRSRRRLVYDAHELYPEVSTLSPAERATWRVAERVLIHRADRVFTVCDSIADELSRRYAIPSPTVLLNCPPRPDGAVPVLDRTLREVAAIADGSEPILLYQGGFAPHRGLPELVEAAGLLERGVVVLMGWGALEERLRNLIFQRGLAERVRIVPAVPPAQVLAYAKQATVGVIPYQPVGLNNRYTTPNKLFDYIAAGLAVAGSRVPELQRFVEGLGVGVTFDPWEVADLADALNSLLGDPSRLEAMRARALEVRERFTWEAVEPALLDAYARL